MAAHAGAGTRASHAPEPPEVTFTLPAGLGGATIDWTLVRGDRRRARGPADAGRAARGRRRRGGRHRLSPLAHGSAVRPAARLSPAVHGGARRCARTRLAAADRGAGPLPQARTSVPALGRDRAALRRALAAQLGHGRLHRSRRPDRAGRGAGRERGRGQSAARAVPRRRQPHQPVLAIQPAVFERVLPRPRGGARPRREQRGARPARRWRLSPRAGECPRRRAGRLSAVWRLKLRVLELLFASFQRRHLAASTERALAFRDFRAEMGQALEQHAVFDALHEHALRDRRGLVLAATGRRRCSGRTPPRSLRSRASIVRASTSSPICNGWPISNWRPLRGAPAPPACRSACTRTSRSG